MATYYIDRAIGSDSNSGLGQLAGPSGPLRSIQAAFNKAIGGGDTLYVKNGTYTENLWLQKSGANGNPLLISNYPGHAPVIDPGAYINAGHVNSDLSRRLYIYNGYNDPLHDIIVQGFRFKNGYEGIKVEGGSDRITIRYNTFEDCYANCLLTTGNDMSIYGNTFLHAASGYIAQGCLSPSFVQENCNQSHVWYHTGQRALFYNNLMVDCDGGQVLQLAGYDGSNYPLLNPAYFGYTGRVSNNTFVYGRRCASIIIYKPLAINSIVENNIFFENNQLNVFDATQGIAFYFSGGGHIVRNNLFYATAPGHVGAITDNLGGKYTESNNLVNTNPPGFVLAPPSYAPSPAPNFHLLSSSAARGMGVDLSSIFTVDLDGVTRVAPWDVGALAFAGGAPPDVTPPGIPQGVRVI